MKKLIAIILVLIGYSSFGQNYLVQPAPWKFTKGVRFDSTFRIFNLPIFTGDTIIAFNPYTKKIGLKILSSSGGTWGSITGTLSNQTDLQNALNLKLNISDTAAMLSPYALTSEVPTYLAGNGIIKGGVTFYRDSLKSTGQYGNSWQNGMYLGSSNNRSVGFRTNNLQRMSIDSAGKVGINRIPTSTYQFGVTGDAQITGTNGGGLNVTSAGAAAVLSITATYPVLRFNTGDAYIDAFGTGKLLIRTIGDAERIVLQNNGNVTIGGSTSISRFAIPVAPTASTNYGLFSMSNTTTAFNGSTTGKAVLAATGTYQAFNTVGSFAYNFIDAQKNGLSVYRVDSTGKNTFASTITTGGTTGDQTINKPSGTVNIAAAGTNVTVTNSLVSTSSIVVAVVRTNDTTAYIKNVVPSAGSFVITLGAAATSEVSIGWIVYN